MTMKHKEIRVQHFGDNMIQAIQDGNWLAVVALLVGLLVLRFRRFTEDFDWHRARRLRVLKQSLRSRVLDESTRKILEDELRTLLVVRACGQRIDSTISNAIVRLHQADARKLPIFKLLAASRFLVVNDRGIPSIEIPRIEIVDRAVHVVATVISFGVILMAMFLLAIAPFGAQSVTIVTVLKLLGLIGALTLVLVHIATQSRPYIVARSIAAEVAAIAKLMAPERLPSEILSLHESRPEVAGELGGCGLGGNRSLPS